jgi:VanZ family protein
MQLRRLWPAILWAVFILILTGTPGNYIPSVSSFWEWLKPDKLVHLFAFGILTFLILYGVMEQYLSSRRRYVYVVSAVGISLAYGLLTELMQVYVFTGRYGSFYDFLADSLGATLGWIAFRLYFGKKIKRETNPNTD